MTALRIVATAVRRRAGTWFAIAAGFAVAFPLAQMVMMAARYRALPNYVTWYDWPGNVLRILRGTPALADTPPIIADEWLLEIGSINRAYGHGIAEWSFALIPAKMLVVLMIGALIATNVVLLRAAKERCGMPAALAAGATTGGGALAGLLASITVTSIACCAAPSWISGLLTLGVGVSTAFWLQPAGPWLVAGGVTVLALCAAALAWRLGATEARDGSPFGQGTRSWPSAS